MRIRNIKKSDINEYILLRRQEERDYSEIVGERQPHLSISILRKEVSDVINKRKKNYILVVEEEGHLIGYLKGTIYGYSTNRNGYVENIFITKEFRKKGIGRKLIDSLIKFLKSKKIKSILLSVDVQNKPAMNFYKKLNFKLKHYEMGKKI